MKSKPIASAALALLAAGAALISACGDSAGVPLTTTPVPPAAGKVASIDVIDIDQAAHLLYAADRSDQGVDVFDISASRPKYLQTIPMPSGPNGLAIAPELSRLFVGTSGGSVVIVNINTSSSTYGAVISEVKTGEGVDLLDYGTARQRIYAAHSSAGTITSIDAATGTIMAKFAVGSVMLEQPRFDAADGMVYITSPDADALFRIDPNDGHVKTKFTLAGCKPLGLAINPTTNKALMACHKYLLGFDLNTDKVFATFPLGNSDIVTYDPKIDRFFVASLPHAQTPGSVGIFGGNPITEISSAVTKISGNSAAYDETNMVVYTPNILPKNASIASFAMPVPPKPLPGWLAFVATVWPWAVLVAILGLLFTFLGRSADPVRRPAPTPRRVKPVTPTDRPQQA
jgi:DNA-binding beta-propeller fold protein YncE